MIRFIDLRGQIADLDDKDSPHFAWFDTVRDRFLTFDHEQEWTSWEDFVANYQAELRPFDKLERFESLLPSWVKE